MDERSMLAVFFLRIHEDFEQNSISIDLRLTTECGANDCAEWNSCRELDFIILFYQRKDNSITLWADVDPG